MKNGFFYELNYGENGEWIKETLEDMLVLGLRRSWYLRHNVKRRWIQQPLLGDENAAAIWRFMILQQEGRRKRIRELRAYRSNREFAPDLHQNLESWYLQNWKKRKRMGIALIVKSVLTFSWAEDPSCFRDAKTWEWDLQLKSR